MDRTVSHYRALERLGRGGMGEVYKAEDTRLKRIVALKLLPPECVSDEPARQRLIEEAQAAAAINHPHIAAIYELGQSDGQPYIAMEYVKGETLAERIKQGRLEITEAIDIAVQVAEALEAAHRRGLIHCDIKSSNIMLVRDGSVKVLDFGLARLAFNVSQSDDGAAGTAGYISPEQLQRKALDGRTDLFSLGVVLYEMVAGRLPFDSLRAVLTREPPPLGAFRDDVPLELENIIRRAIEKDRERRYQSAQDFLDALLKLKARLEKIHKPSPADQVALEPVAFTQGKVPSRYRRLLLAGAVLPAAIACFDLIFLQSRGAEWIRSAILFSFAAASLVAYLAARRSSRKVVYSLPGGAAFRGLLPFQEADRDRFYGRESETATVFEMIGHSDFRSGVLYGDSGSGKTSLIRAGLVPKLVEEGYIPIYCRSYKDPLSSLLEQCRKQSQLTISEDESEVHYLRRVEKEMGAVLVIICDQFEEFFVNFKTREEREPFLRFVAACHGDSDLIVKFLFAMRSDFLYLIISEFTGRIPEALMGSRLYHLRNFDQEQATQIIEKSARRASLPLEAGLARQVARDLAVGDAVLPSELQIVGERLQSKRIYTTQAYRRAGGKEPLVYSFLEDVIEASGDQEGAHLLLRSLISDDNTRLTLTLDEIGKRTQRSHAQVEHLLTLFVQARLIREIQEEEPWRYELMHEYVIEKINQVTGRVMDATQRANRLFRQYAASYAVDKRTRIPISKLFFIRRYADVERGEREQELLRKSLRRGIVKTSALVLLLAAVTMFAAAALSVTEEWESVRLSDGHTAAALQAVFSPDGRLLVSCGEDGKVIVWDFARRERLATFTDHTDTVSGVAFSPDGRWFATGDSDSNLIVWDAQRLEKAAALEGHQGTVGGLAFSPDGRLLASASSESRTIIRKVESWEKLRELPFGAGEHRALLFSPDSRLLFASYGFQVWDITTGRKVAEHEEKHATWAALSPDAERMVGIDPAGTVTFSEVNRFRDPSQLKSRDYSRVHRDHGRAVAFSPDGRLAATGAEDIILWDAATQTRITRLQYPSIVWSLAFSPDGRWLVSSHGDGSVVVWDVAEREPVANLNQHSGPVRAVAISSDGRRIASASEDRSIIIWDVDSRQKEEVLIGHKTRVSSVAFSGDGTLVVSSDQEGNVIVWDVARRQPLWTARHPFGNASYCLAVSPDGHWVATTGGVYGISEGRHVIDFLKYPMRDQSYGVTFSADGRWLACAARDLVLLDTENWQVADRVAKPQISVSFSPSSKQLVTGSDDGTVRLWQINPLREVAILGKHAARVKFVAFSPDGKEVASASDDQTIALNDSRGRPARRGLAAIVAANQLTEGTAV